VRDAALKCLVARKPRAAAAALIAATGLIVTACASAPHASLPDPPLWSVRASRFVDEAALHDALDGARYRFIGEIHDHAAQHALRARLVSALAAKRPAAVMEIFDIGRDDALAAAQARGGDAEALAAAGALDREAWRWPLHRPVVDAALAAGMPIRAANVERTALMRLARSGSAGAWQPRLDAAPWGERERQAMREAIVDSHCGALPDQAVPAIALAQRIRDAAMAQALAGAARTAGGAVLLAGNGHVRRDLGAPLYLRPDELPAGTADIVTVAFVEATPAEIDAADFPHRLVADHPGFDYIWFTPPTPRPDPCEGIERRLRHPS
jgi:uncharacterized iron-regulated protein